MAAGQANPEIVFVPGFMQSPDAWAAVAQRLPERYPSLCMEHSEHTFEGRLAELATAADGATLCGYSLGGRLALHAVLRDPQRYRALITVGSGAGIAEPTARAARVEADERLAGWMETQPIEAIVAVWERQPLFADQSEALVERQRPGRLGQDPRELALLLRTAGQGALEPVWERLPEISIPTLALAGVLDERYCGAAMRIASSVPRGRHRAVEHAGHAPQLQRPEEIAARLVEFLDDHFG